MTNSPHIELYKKYRPRKWNGLIGQKNLAQSLQANVVEGTTPTAYGFFGPRGCGKTSAAIIMAKALNCEDPPGDGNPCNKCSICKNIDDHNQVGVHYISMAQNGSTDDVRELLRKAWLNQPINKQVWILDEIHTIHKNAFDSLLIPLEKKEMPSMFILCSTAVEKVPETVRSRIQMRNFTLVPSTTLHKYIQKIAEKESLDVSDEVLSQAVRLGRGSVRDTLSNLESLTQINDVGFSLSASGKIIEAIAKQDYTDSIVQVEQALNDGMTPRDLASHIIEDLGTLIRVSAGVEDKNLTSVAVTDVDEVLAGFINLNGLRLGITRVGDAFKMIQEGVDGKIILMVEIAGLIEKLEQSKKARVRRSSR